MKILLISDCLERIGGAEIYLYTLADALRQGGNQVEIFGTSGKYMTRDTIISRLFSIKYYLKAKRAIRNYKPDIIHVNKFNMVLSPSVLIAAKQNATRVVATIHDFGYFCPDGWGIYKDTKQCEKYFSWRCLFRRCYHSQYTNNDLYRIYNTFKIFLHMSIMKRYVDVFICPSKCLATWAENTGLINVIHVNNFVDSGKSEGVITQNKNTLNQLLFVGRLTKEKGVDTLIKAVSYVRTMMPKVQLSILGEGPEKENLASLCKKLGVQDRVTFYGKVPNTDIGLYYKNSLCLVEPSIWMENSPFVVIESMYYGIPVIASNIGGLPELVKDGYNGFIFEANNEQELAEKIINVMRNPQAAAEMGENGNRVFYEQYNLESNIGKIIATYNVGI